MFWNNWPRSVSRNSDSCKYFRASFSVLFCLILSHCTAFINVIQGDVHFNLSDCETLDSHSRESEGRSVTDCDTGWFAGEVPTFRRVSSTLKTESEATFEVLVSVY